MQMYDMHLAAGMPGHSYIWRTMALCRQKRNIDGVALREIFFCARIFFCILELPRGRCGLLQQDIGQVGNIQECAGKHCTDNKQYKKDHICIIVQKEFFQIEFFRIHHCTPIAYLIIIFSVSSSFCSSPVTLPFLMITTRSHMPMISGISEEIMITATPFSARLLMIL